jgi:hypothetical protein
MQRHYLLTILLVLSLTVAVAGQNRVAVLGVFGEAPLNYKQFLETRITKEHVSLNRLEVLDRTHAEQLLKEISFQVALGENSVGVGKMLGADIGLLATIDLLYTEENENTFNTKAEITLKTVEIATARILATATVKGTAEANSLASAEIMALENCLLETNATLYSLFGLTSEILEVKGKVLYILPGREALINGGVYSVIRTEEIKGHPMEREIGKLRYEESKDLSRGIVLAKTEEILEKDTVGHLKARSGNYRLYSLGTLEGLKGGLSYWIIKPFELSFGALVNLNIAKPTNSLELYLEVDKEFALSPNNYSGVIGAGFGGAWLIQKLVDKKYFGKSLLFTGKIGIRFYNTTKMYELALEPRLPLVTNWSESVNIKNNPSLWLTLSWGSVE